MPEHLACRNEELSLYPPFDGNKPSQPLCYLRWTGIFLVTIFWGTASIFGSLISRSPSFATFCMRQWAGNILWLSRAKVDVRGLENIPLNRPCLFVANHTGIHDITALSCILPGNINWVAKASLFRIPFLGWHMRRNGYVAVERDHSKKAKKGHQSINQAVSVLKNASSASLIIFPEGTRSRDGRMRQFRTGAFVIAKKVSVPIIPVAVEGSWRIIRPDSFMIYPHNTIQIRIHPAIYTEDLEIEELRSRTYETIRRALIALRSSS